ncbi:MAG TPA: hypothetical protein DG942_00310 [Ruminococcaceae bacterium]|jgi:hypothetical protein|nr:hypothetical protein [Oscillospiraceae bacterium]
MNCRLCQRSADSLVNAYEDSMAQPPFAMRSLKLLKPKTACETTFTNNIFWREFKKFRCIYYFAA